MKLSLFLLSVSCFHLAVISLTTVWRFIVFSNKEKYAAFVETCSQPDTAFSLALTLFSMSYILWYNWGF